MPASVASVLGVFDVIDLGFDVFDLPPSCLQLSSFYSQLLFYVLAPCVLGLLILACSMATEVLAKRKAANLKAGLIRALPYLMCLLFFTFPLVSSRAIQALDCEDFDEDRTFLKADYSLDCSSPEYSQVLSLAWVAIALYPVGVPLLYLALLLFARKAILTEQPTALSRSLTFLHQDYTPSMFWWEIVEIIKKAHMPPHIHSHIHSHCVPAVRPCPPVCAAVSRRPLCAHLPRLDGANHHWHNVFTCHPSLYVDRRAISTPRTQ